MQNNRWVFLLLLIICMAGCATTGQLTKTGPSLATQLLSYDVPYRIYAPPGWDGTSPLPLIVYLHDRGGHCTDLETARVIEYVHQLNRSGEMPPAIIAAPENSDGYWWDFKDGTQKYTSFVATEFIEHIKSKYPVRPGPAGLHILGVGTGAMGAATLAYTYPNRFGTVGALGGYFFDDLGASVYVDKHFFSDLDKILGSSDDRQAMLNHSVYHRIQSRKNIGKTRFVMGAGAFSDWNTTESNELFRQHLMFLNIPHDYIVYHGTAKWESRRNILPVFIGLQLGDRRNRGEVNGMPYDVMKYR